MMGRLFLNVPADGKAHWVIYRNAIEAPEYPWFVEHRIVPVGHPRYEHDDSDEFEYGSFETFEQARDAMVEWSAAFCSEFAPWREWLVQFEMNITARSAHEAAHIVADVLATDGYAFRGYYNVWIDNDEDKPPVGVDLEDDESTTRPNLGQNGEAS